MANSHYTADSAKLPDLLSINDAGRDSWTGQAAMASGVAPSNRFARLLLIVRN